MWKRYHSRIIFWLIALVFLCATNAFIFFGYSFQSVGRHYTGINIFGAADKLVYYSQIEQGRQGLIMIKNLHTSEPQKGLFFAPHWWLIGQTGRWLNISNDVAYQLYRIILSLIVLALLWYLASKIFNTVWERAGAFSLVLFASGWGWIVGFFQPEVLTSRFNALLNKPVDLYVTEMAPLSNSQQSPLFILSHIALLTVMILVLRWRHSWSWYRGIIIAGISSLLVIIHPYDMWIIVSVLVAWSGYKMWRGAAWTSLGYPAAAVVGAVLGAGYVYAGLVADVAIAGWSKQNLVYSPPLYNYIIGLGLLFPLWLVGLYSVIKHKRDSAWWMLLALWSVAGWLMIYLPLDYNRRLANAWQIPLGFIAYQGLRVLGSQLRILYFKIVFYSFMVFGLLIGSFYSLWLPIQQIPLFAADQRFYLSDDLHQALVDLKNTTTNQDVILSSDSKLDVIISAYTGRRMFIGHEHQTVNWAAKEQQRDEFWSAASGMNKKAFLSENHISYIATLYSDTYGMDYYNWLDQQSYVRLITRYHDGAIYQVLP